MLTGLSLQRVVEGLGILELQERPNADPAERQLLFSVILTCSNTSTLDEVLATAPEAKGLSNLARVDRRFRGN